MRGQTVLEYWLGTHLLKIYRAEFCIAFIGNLLYEAFGFCNMCLYNTEYWSGITVSQFTNCIRNKQSDSVNYNF